MFSIVPRTHILLQGLFTLVLLFGAMQARSQDCECLNCPQALPPPGLDSCSTFEFILNVKGAENDDLANPFQGVCGLKVHFQHNYVWSLSMCLVSPGGDTIEFIGPNLISGFASSALSSWNISFVQSSILPNPDPGKFDKWNNNQLWAAFQSYTGTYHPYKGNLEDFDSGPVNGQWKILVKNCTELEKGSFINFSILFCDDSGIDCSCQAYAGNLNIKQPLILCQNDPALDLDVKPVFIAPQPDTTEYGYTFVLSSNGVIQDYANQIDLTGALPGNYQVCGLSYLKKDLDSIPAPDGLLAVSEIREALFSDAPPFCGDITTNCLNIQIAAPPPPVLIDTMLCAGKCFPLGNKLYCQSIMVTDTFVTKTGCDSIVTLHLTVQSADVIQLTDTICNGAFYIVGNNFYNKTGLYKDTLISPFTGCDSIVHLDLFVVNVDAQAQVQGVLDCNTPTVGISGINSNFNVLNPWIQWTTSPGGQIVGGQNTLFALVGQPAVYSLKISKLLANGKVCSDSVAVTVMANPDSPNLKGPSKVAYCEGNMINLNQAGFSDMSQLGGQLTFHSDYPLDISTQIGPMVDPTQTDTVIVFYRYGNCTDTLAFTWTMIPAPKATIKSSIHICNADGGGIFNTLINFDTLISGANVVGSWANTDGAPVGGVFPILNFNGVPGPTSYTFTWSSLNAMAPCANITRTIEIFVENCGCPSVATIAPGPFCTTDPGVDLQDFVLTQEPGQWTVAQVPAGSQPALILQDSLLVTGKDTGHYTLIFKLTSQPPLGCPDSAAHLVSIHAPPLIQLIASDTVCNQVANGQWPTVVDLDQFILQGTTQGNWAEIDVTGASGTLPVLDFTGVQPGQYTFEFTTKQAQLPCPEAIGTTEIVVLNCTCPPLHIFTLDTLCNDGNAVPLSEFEVNVAGGLWSLVQSPAGTNPAIIQGGQIVVAGADTGHYTLTYTLLPAAPGNCPQSDTLDLMVLSPPSALIPVSDTVCNQTLNGEWPTTLDFQSLVLAGDTSGQWSALTPVPGATGTLPILDFTGATPGGYIFIYGFQTVPPPCKIQSYSTIVHVIDCTCPTVDDVTICNDAADLDLSTLLPSGIVANWVIVTTPPGMNAASLSGNILTTNKATPGVYYLKASWTNPPGDPCPFEAIVQVWLEAIPQVNLLPTISVCSTAGPFGTPLLGFDTLFVNPPSPGNWSDVLNSGATGTFPNLDFTGVAPGIYPFVYQTAVTSTVCPSTSDTILIEVTACACPPLTVSGPGKHCSSETTISLDNYLDVLNPGFWTMEANPPGGSSALLSGSNLEIQDGDPGIYEFQFTLATLPPPGCPDTVNLVLELIRQPQAGVATDTLSFCPGEAVSLDLFNSLTGNDAGGVWQNAPTNPVALTMIHPVTGLWNGTTPKVSGEYQALYIVSAQMPCLADTSILEFVIHPAPLANAGPDQVLGCTANQVSLGATGMPDPTMQFNWILGGTSLGSSANLVVTAPGHYVLMVSDPVTTCFAIDTVVITSGQPGPTSMGLEVIQPTCQSMDGEIHVTNVTGGIGPFTYGLNQLPVGTNSSYTGLNPGTFTIHVEDAQGCPLDTVVTLQNASAFTVDLGPDVTVPPGTILDLEGILAGTTGNIVSVAWQPLNIQCASCLAQSVTISETIVIDIQVENEDGCIASDDILVIVFDGPTRFYIPSAFSPNGDGLNDGFTIYGNELVSRILDLSIYDRWGNQIFQRSDLLPGEEDTGWDGTYRGDPLDPALFIYTARILMTSGHERLIKGEVLLMK